MNEFKHKKEFYTCKRWRLLQYLMERGFEPMETMPDPMNPKYCWWKFANSVEFEAAIDEYFANK
jgi:hypothetical protein